MGLDAESQLRLLADVGPILASTLDYEETLAHVAQIVVEALADLCIIDVVDDDGTVRRLKVAARDPVHRAICDGLERVQLRATRPYLGAAALRTKRTVLMRASRPEEIESLAQDGEDLRLLRSLGIRSLIATPLLAKGSLLGGLVLISCRKSRRYGQADVRLAEELAHRAALSLDNARLYRAAQRATAARDEVVGIVAHDLRNPLYSVLLNAEILSRSLCPAEAGVRRPIEGILSSATRMNRLIGDLLDVSRIEANGFSIDPRAVAVEDILTDTVESQRGLASSASVSLRVDLPAPVAPVWADRHRVLQVMENLVGNALKFSSRGAEVVIGACTRGSNVLLWVRDTGCGIDREDLNHVFDRFWQARRRSGTGAGLGLSIVKGIVEAHGGCVWVQSRPGQGATFFFTLPPASAADDRPPPRAEPALVKPAFQ